MTIETNIDRDQPDLEPGNPPPRAQPDVRLIRRSTQAEEVLANAESFVMAFLQSALLTAISAGLVWWSFAASAQTRAAAVDEANHAFFSMPLRTARTKFLLGMREQAAITVRSWNHERSHADF